MMEELIVKTRELFNRPDSATLSDEVILYQSFEVKLQFFTEILAAHSVSETKF